MLALFWDIDGTLLTTGRAGVYALEDALAEVTGVRADLMTFDTAGHPDHGIARRLLTDVAGIDAPGDALVSRLVARYEDLLPAALPRRAGRVLPNVRPILERVAREPGMRSLLLTGNTRRGAAAKLRHYELADFFAGGAFSDDAVDRDGIARVALERWTTELRAPATATFVIGDTPHDVRCGRAIGAATVAVATGGYSVEQLAACEPTLVLPELPAADAFLATLRALGRHALGPEAA